MEENTKYHKSPVTNHQSPITNHQSQITNDFDDVKKPAHYNKYDMEVIDMMLKIWGDAAVINYCRLNAFKYRMRAGNKNNNSIEKDLAKEKWYLDKIQELNPLAKTVDYEDIHIESLKDGNIKSNTKDINKYRKQAPTPPPIRRINDKNIFPNNNI